MECIRLAIIDVNSEKLRVPVPVQIETQDRFVSSLSGKTEKVSGLTNPAKDTGFVSNLPIIQSISFMKVGMLYIELVKVDPGTESNENKKATYM